ncbi:MAG: dipeptidyl-peptidase 3 family protein [Longimicrobiales bacterium]
MKLLRAAGAAMLLGACATADEPAATTADTSAEARLDKYTTVRLTSPMEGLTDRDRQVVGLLIDAATHMDSIFWLQAFGEPDTLLAALDDAGRAFARINYGPWDRLANNEPFVEGYGPKPAGANFYPHDMTKEEFEAAAAGGDGAALRDPYTLVRRDGSGALQAIPYHEAFRTHVEAAAGKLREAASYADDPGLKRYLEMRAEALLTDDYQPSDFAWLDMRGNPIDVIIGPIENYEDQLYGYKTAYEGVVLIKDREWSERLSRYATMLPALQQGLPVDARYRSEQPGTDSDLNAYDVVYYAGDGNAGSKSIAINLPNDEEVQLQKGTRRLQLKNAMRAKFDEILVPIANVLIDPDQRDNVTFDAFFSNVMFHEVAHGLGIKNTINGSGTVREALKEHASALEEGKADVLGLYMVTSLQEQGELGDAPLEDYYTTFLASIFRSVRFGAASAHGRANMARFNYFAERGAFERNPDTGTYRVDVDQMRQAMNDLSELILTLQGNGDYGGVAAFVEEYGNIGPDLQAGLDRVNASGIPVDVVWEQGREVLGLN